MAKKTSTKLLAAAALVAGCAAVSGCAAGTPPDQESEQPPAAQCAPIMLPQVSPPADPECANDDLTSYAGLLVLAPHPDDEVLGFAGLVSAYLEQGKPVQVVVVTDGDAYCEACSFWKTSSVAGATCNAEELSNFATPEVDSFAEVRHAESRAAAALVGYDGPEFLRYPDTGLGAAWSLSQSGDLHGILRRSDFSHCDSCGTCVGGYGEGPDTDLSAATLVTALFSHLEATGESTLVATTHPLDGHGDHAALGRFVRLLNEDLATPRQVVYGVIHAHTPKDERHPDCWHPGPAAPHCACMEPTCAEQDPTRIATLAAFRLRPDWPATLPDDTDYGESKHLCLAEQLYAGDDPIKLRAIRAYGSQLGTEARSGEHPSGLSGMMDCSGYLTSFARRTEAFFVPTPAEDSDRPDDP